jgi:predicted RNA-binding Zn-ribbon protein involved in translation (DUF1610 family)
MYAKHIDAPKVELADEPRETFNCPECGMKFMMKRTMKRHM